MSATIPPESMTRECASLTNHPVPTGTSATPLSLGSSDPFPPAAVTKADGFVVALQMEKLDTLQELIPVPSPVPRPAFVPVIRRPAGDPQC